MSQQMPPSYLFTIFAILNKHIGRGFGVQQRVHIKLKFQPPLPTILSAI